MSDRTARFRKALGRDARDLQILNHRLRRLRRQLGRLPAAPVGETEDLPDRPGEVDELRATVECVLADHLVPALLVLQAAAQEPPA